MIKLTITTREDEIDLRINEMKERYKEKYYLDRHVTKILDDEKLVKIEMIFKPIKNKVFLYD